MSASLITEYVEGAEIGELELQLQRRFRGQIRELKIEATEHGLILMGRSATYYAKQLAQQALLQATFLPLLSNDIQVI